MSGFNPHLSINTSTDIFYDPRYTEGPWRNVRLQRASTNGGGSISKSPDGMRCVVSGTESLKVVRVVDPTQASDPEDVIQYKTSAVGKGRYRIEASRNLWEGSGLKVDSASTSVAWCREEYKNKILTSARNGELIMWDINKSGSKYERKSKDHTRSIHALSISPVVSHYAITGSGDGDLRVWDLREFQKSIMRIRYPTGIRGIAFSPVMWSPLQAVVGLENGSIYRWDLKMGQRGALDRIPVAHSASVTSLDWCSTSTATTASGQPTSETSGNGYGWIVSGGLDRCVKVWDLTSVTSSKSSHMPHKPAYTLHPSFQVRRVLWRPSHECEVAIIPNGDFGSGSNPDMSAPPSAGTLTRTSSMRSAHHGSQGVFNKLGLEIFGGDASNRSGRKPRKPSPGSSKTPSNGIGDAAEIWDVRRGWIAKWTVNGSTIEGGCTDLVFGDANSLWTQHGSGTFSQIDLRDVAKPIDAIPRVSLTSEVSGLLTFVSSSASRWELPYDDIRLESLKQANGLGIKQKAIGDPAFQNDSQIVGTFDGLESDNLYSFIQLAKNYIIEGDDRQKICIANAQIAFEADHFEAAQIWSLIATSLSNVVPDPPARPPLPKNGMVHSVSAPAMISYSFPESKTTSGGKSPRSSSFGFGQAYARSLSTASVRRKLETPSSSNNTSPHHGLAPLPPTTPITSRLPSYLGRRESIDSNISGVPSVSRRPSAYRRPSTSYSASPSSSLKHVGEGALADSDSSSSDESRAKSKDDIEDDEPEVRKTHISPVVAASRIAHPSPLSRVTPQQRWKEDEEGRDDDNDDDEASASPRSTDSEISDGGNSGRPGTFTHRRSFRRNSTSLLMRRSSKSKSLSSTLQNSVSKSSSRLSISSRPLIRQDSSSSIRTVTAGGSYRGDQNGFSSLKVEETIKDIRKLTRESSETRKEVDSVVKTERRRDVVVKEEAKMKDIVWTAIREKLEEFADDGDIQTCAMLAMVIPEELCIGKLRRLMFVESYIERLMRLQLHICAAHIRKHAQLKEVQSSTLVETVIYTACGRCRKPFIATSNQSVVLGDYSYCANCKSPMSCGICHLPVRGLMFQCSVCGHGGHQLCYRRYYMSRPMVEILSDTPTDTASHSNQARGSESSRSVAGTASIASYNTDDESTAGTSVQSASIQSTSSENEPSDHLPTSRLLGHPCVVPLCRHHCWIANIQDNPEAQG